jgi:hypothetical protein
MSNIKNYSKIYNSSILLNSNFNINVDDPIILYNQTYNQTLDITNHEETSDNLYLLYMLLLLFIPYIWIKIYYNCMTNNTSENTKIINANAIVINDDIDIIIVNVEFINEDEEIKNNT